MTIGKVAMGFNRKFIPEGTVVPQELTSAGIDLHRL